MDVKQIESTVKQLSRSQRGRNAMRRLLEWLDDDGLGLDGGNQMAVLNLLDAAWDKPGTTRDLMRQYLDQ